MRKRILKIYGVTLVVGTIYYLWILLTGFSVPCLYYETTGYLCPGCGTSRMFLHLAKFNITAAFNSNPAVFLLLVFWNAVALFCFIGRPRIFGNKRFLYSCLAVSIASLMIFCIIRNVT